MAARCRQRRPGVMPGLVEQLTARELEVLALLAAGAPNPRIAEQLVVSLDTVQKHVSHLLGKLGAANRTEAVTRDPQPDPGGTVVRRWSGSWPAALRSTGAGRRLVSGAGAMGATGSPGRIR
jgi:DNA-binding CsgD family transcriptional regulator